VHAPVGPDNDAKVPATDNEHLDRSGGHPGAYRSVDVDRETELASVGSMPPKRRCIGNRATQAVCTDEQPTSDAGRDPAATATQRNPGTMRRQFDDACGHGLKHVHAGLGSAVDEQLIEPVAWHQHPAAGITCRQRCRKRRSPNDVHTDLVRSTKGECSNVLENTGPL